DALCCVWDCVFCCFFFQAEDGIRDKLVTGVQTCALPISNETLLTRDQSDYRSGAFLAQLLTAGRVGEAAALIRELLASDDDPWRSEERRVGKECRSRWGPYE